MAARVPCVNLPKIYGFKERSVLEIILAVCMNTDRPPSPNINAADVKIIVSSPYDIRNAF